MCRAAALVTALGLLAGVARGDAEAAFEMIFGAEARKAAATPSTADDAALAARLLKAAGGIKDAPKLQTLIYKKAYEFARKDPGAHDRALEALELWAAAAPAEVGDLQAKKLDLGKRRFRAAQGAARKKAGQAYLDMLLAAAADKTTAGEMAEASALYAEALPIARFLRSPQTKEIIARRRVVTERLAAARRLAVKRKGLEVRLRDSPKDRAARRALILLYLLDDNNPQKAAELLTPELDEALRTYVPLAAKPVEKTAEAACLELGAWFERLGAKASPQGKAVALARAAAYYRRCLRLRVKQDAVALKVKVSLEAIEKALGKLLASGVVRAPYPKTLTLDLGGAATMRLALIPAGEFSMGSGVSAEALARQYGAKVEAFAAEHPRHKVRITRPFYMGVTEVTQSQWKAVMGTEPWKGKKGVKEAGENAANCTSWDDATAFCKALSKKVGKAVRLPTEAEWEYACRAGTTTKCSFGDDAAKLGDSAWWYANARKAGEAYPHRVARKRPNAWGLYDMHGNVWELCADWYDTRYYSARANDVDPAGPAVGRYRVIRGGSWLNKARHCRSANRLWIKPSHRADGVGFRVVVSVISGVD